MSLERQDVRAKLDHDTHAQLRAICDAEGVTIADWVEAAIKPMIEKRVHAAMMLAGALERQGITGINRESPGRAGK